MTAEEFLAKKPNPGFASVDAFRANTKPVFYRAPTPVKIGAGVTIKNVEVESGNAGSDRTSE